MFADNDKAIFGAGSDLQIYSDGDTSYINENSGTGALNIQGGNVFIRTTSGANTLFYGRESDNTVLLYGNGSVKLATTATGIDVTGTATMDGLTVDGTGAEVISVNSTANGSQIVFDSATTSSDWSVGIANDATDDFLIYQGGAGTGDILLYTDGTERLRVLHGGNVGIGTSSPSAELSVSNSGAEGYEISPATVIGGVIRQLAFNRSTSAYIPMRVQASEHQFYTSGNEAMRLDSSGNVGIGTSSPSAGLQVAKGSSTIPAAGASTSSACFGNDTSDNDYGVVVGANSNGVGYISSQRTDGAAITYNLAIQPNGGNVGIGTNSPSAKLHSFVGASAVTGIYANNANDAASTGVLIHADSLRGDTSAYTLFKASNSVGTKMIVQGDGNVGIGTSSPDARVKIVGDDTASGITLRLDGGGVQTQRGIVFAVGGADYGFINIPVGGGGAMSFGTGSAGAAAERMRIDSSGNLLVGTPSVNPGLGNTNEGHSLNASGAAVHSADGNNALRVNRNTSDGTVITIAKDGTTVGSIASRSGSTTMIHLNPSSTNGAGIGGATKTILPTDHSALSDDNISLGNASNRFKDLYLSGGAYLGGTAAANKLDDYEEGTWTPVVRDSSGTVGTIMAISTSNCKYIKVGKVVTITGQITRNDATSLTGNLFITGLPFTQVGGQQMGGSVWVDNVSGDVLGLITGGDSTIFTVRSIASPDAYVTTNQWSNNRPIYFSRTYRTT